MKWVKAPDELKTLLDKAIEEIDCEKKLMFGYPAYFIRGNMFAGLFQDLVFLRLSPDQALRLKKQHQSLAALEPMPGRPMKEYFVLPRELYARENLFTETAMEAANYVRTLPEKTKSNKRKRAGTPSKGSKPGLKLGKSALSKGSDGKRTKGQKRARDF